MKIYVLRRCIVINGEKSHFSPLFFKSRDNAENALSEWIVKMKYADYTDWFGGYIETSELEDA